MPPGALLSVGVGASRLSANRASTLASAAPTAPLAPIGQRRQAPRGQALLDVMPASFAI
jgi:hypothetical protein